MNYTTATASVIGSSHYKLYYNNQDAYDLYQDRNIIVGIVADGCGSGINSEVGARLGVNFVVNFCREKFTHKPFDVEVLKNGLVEYLKNIVKNQKAVEEIEFIENYLFFTLFGFIIQKDHTHIFHSGDGMYVLNDKEVIIEQNNKPHYVAKSLISGNPKMNTESIATQDLHRLLVATDGLLHLNDKFLQGEKVLGMSKITDMFDNNDYFDDIVALPKDLTDLAVNKNILKDDSTIMLLKRELP